MQPVISRLGRLPDICAVIGKPKSSIYADIKAGLFPAPIKIGLRSSAWPLAEISEIVAARIAGKSDDEIRQLVADLMAARKIAASSAEA